VGEISKMQAGMSKKVSLMYEAEEMKALVNRNSLMAPVQKNVQNLLLGKLFNKDYGGFSARGLT
jgi:hypothetical protein